MDVIDSADFPVAPQGAPRTPSCWRARRLCPAYFLTDIGVEFPVAYTRQPNSSFGYDGDFDIRFVWTIGVMGNRGRHSHGGAVSLVGVGANEGFPFTLAYRYRNWLGESAAVDLSLGYIQHGFYGIGRETHRGKGVTTMIAWTPNRWIGLSARGDFMRAGGRDRRALMLGVQSTRVSEYAFRFVLVEGLRALLGQIGIEVEDEEE